MTHVLVLKGGTSSERAVSLRSGQAVATALLEAGFSVTEYDLTTDTFSELLPLLKTIDVVFPALHGRGGENGELQSMLDTVGARYIGSRASASRDCFDKSTYRNLLIGHGVAMANGALVHAWDVPNNPLFKAPFVLKPYDGGSSVDTFIVRDIGQADWPAIEIALKTHGEMLLEALVEGVEITVGILKDRALPVVEIVPPVNQEFDYANKYNGATQELCPPLHVTAQIQHDAQALALRIHTLCGCKDLSRTDMIVHTDGSLIVLETNTLPGLTEQSLFPKAAAAAGISMPQLTEVLVQTVLKEV